MTNGSNETSYDVILRQAQWTHTLAQILLPAIVARLDRPAAWGAPYGAAPPPQAGWGGPMPAGPVNPHASAAPPSCVGAASAVSYLWHP